MGTLTIATAITGTAVVLATGSDLPAAAAAGNLSRATLVWVLFGMGALLMYLISTLIAGLTIHLFTGNRNRDPELKRLGIAAVHGLPALEPITLAVMLVIGVLATPAADTASKDAPPGAYQSGCPIQQGKSPNVPDTDLPPNACMATQRYC